MSTLIGVEVSSGTTQIVYAPHGLASANCGTAWGQAFTYDQQGNANSSGSLNYTTWPGVGNHILFGGVTYDSMGNITNDGSNTYSYDAEGRQVTVAEVQTIYDALGRAVEQNRNGTLTEILYSPSGQKFAYMNGSSVQKYILPLAGGLSAIYNSSGLQYYRHADWLGSERFASTPAGAVSYDAAYSPFGYPYGEMGSTDRSFTGQTQDTTPGIYDFLFRQYSPSQGRWLVPAPAGRPPNHIESSHLPTTVRVPTPASSAWAGF